MMEIKKFQNDYINNCKSGKNLNSNLGLNFEKPKASFTVSNKIIDANVKQKTYKNNGWVTQ